MASGYVQVSEEQADLLSVFVTSITVWEKKGGIECVKLAALGFQRSHRMLRAYGGMHILHWRPEKSI